MQCTKILWAFELHPNIIPCGDIARRKKPQMLPSANVSAHWSPSYVMCYECDFLHLYPKLLIWMRTGPEPKLRRTQHADCGCGCSHVPVGKKPNLKKSNPRYRALTCPCRLTSAPVEPESYQDGYSDTRLEAQHHWDHPPEWTCTTGKLIPALPALIPVMSLSAHLGMFRTLLWIDRCRQDCQELRRCCRCHGVRGHDHCVHCHHCRRLRQGH